MKEIKMKRKNSILIIMLLIISMLTVACSQPTPAPATTTATTQQVETTAPAQTEKAVEIPKKVMAVGSASSGSLYVTFTAAWADMLMKNIDGLNITVEPGGSSQNIQTINSGDTDFGITATLQSYPAYYGLGW